VKSSSSKKEQGKDFHSQHPHLFSKSERDFRIGRDIQPKRDLSRFVKWPRYVRVQRQRAILKKRLKVPASIHQFATTLDKNAADTVFRLLARYRPESKEQKKKRLYEAAKEEAKGGKKDEQKKTPAEKPVLLKYGLNHVTTLIEQRKAKLVVIAHDVDPIEIVVWLPALCRKQDVPYCIVKSKSRLGQLVHMKTATVVALTDVKRDDVARLEQAIGIVRPKYNDAVVVRLPGGGIMGIKAQHVIRRREKIAQREAQKALRA